MERFAPRHKVTVIGKFGEELGQYKTLDRLLEVPYVRKHLFTEDLERTHDLILRQRAEVDQHADLGDPDIGKHLASFNRLLRSTHQDAAWKI